MEIRASDQLRIMLEKGMTVQQIAVVLSTTLGVNITEKQIRRWMDEAKPGRRKQ